MCLSNSPLRSQGHMQYRRKKYWKKCKPEVIGDTKEPVPFRFNGTGIHPSSESVATFTRHTQIQDRRIPTLRWWSRHRLPPPTKRCPETDTHQQRKSQLPTTTVGDLLPSTGTAPGNPKPPSGLCWYPHSYGIYTYKHINKNKKK